MNLNKNNVRILNIGIFFLLTIGIIFLITFSCSSDESGKIDIKLNRLEKKIEKFDKIEKDLEKREKDLEKREKELLGKSKNTLNNQKSKENDSSNSDIKKSKEKSFEERMLESIKKDEQEQKIREKIRESSILFKSKKRFKYITKNNKPYGRNCVVVYDDYFETYTLTFVTENSQSLVFKLKRSNFFLANPHSTSYTFIIQGEFYDLSDSKR